MTVSAMIEGISVGTWDSLLAVLADPGGQCARRNSLLRNDKPWPLATVLCPRPGPPGQSCDLDHTPNVI
jgi:hypothetical protein